VTASICFGEFELDAADRQLRRHGETVELNGRYFDALALLASEPGRLVTKDRFLDEVWRGVPVTDEALTQCIKTLRRQLGDDASRPRFIETVPKHGYRFIAPVAEGAAPKVVAKRDLRQPLGLGLAGTAGGVLAGMLGGLFYGFAGAAPGVGAISVLLVLLTLTMLVAAIGGAGVAFGIAAAGLVRRPGWHWTVAGGAFGGVLVGAFVKLLGLDAFTLLLGRSPGDMTGAPEGAILGAAVGLGFVLAARQDKLRVGVLLAGLCGAVAGLLIPLLGLHMMGGSLDLLANRFPGSRLRLDGLGALAGERGFGPVSHMVTGALEGALFAGCVVVAMRWWRRRTAVIEAG
jgi:DNA-binding winged helix-turn-helix (wHTH) protein